MSSHSTAIVIKVLVFTMTVLILTIMAGLHNYYYNCKRRNTIVFLFVQNQIQSVLNGVKKEYNARYNLHQEQKGVHQPVPPILVVQKQENLLDLWENWGPECMINLNQVYTHRLCLFYYSAIHDHCIILIM